MMTNIFTLTLAVACFTSHVGCSDPAVHHDRVASLRTEITGLTQHIQRLSDSTARRQQAEGATQKQVFYGFTAFANTEVQYDEGATINFQETIINIGNGFNTANGMFTCPTTGYYYFVVHLYNSSGRDIGVTIVKGSEELTKAYITTGQTQNRKSSTSVVQQCNQGEQVFIRCKDDGDLEGNSNAETSFSGFIISEV